jgi:hypothetical protein
MIYILPPVPEPFLSVQLNVDGTVSCGAVSAGHCERCPCPVATTSDVARPRSDSTLACPRV